MDMTQELEIRKKEDEIILEIEQEQREKQTPNRNQAPTLEQLKEAFDQLITESNNANRQTYWGFVQKIYDQFLHEPNDPLFEDVVENDRGETLGWGPLVKLLWAYLNLGQDKVLRINDIITNKVDDAFLQRN